MEPRPWDGLEDSDDALETPRAPLRTLPRDMAVLGGPSGLVVFEALLLSEGKINDDRTCHEIIYTKFIRFII